MRKSAVFVAFSFLAAAGPAAPQAPKPAPAAAEEGPASSPVAPGPRLNLKLDGPARFYTQETPPDGAGGKSAADNLPSLGGNPVSLEPPPASRSRPASSPYPNDPERRP
jgi:hypothetical protein